MLNPDIQSVLDGESEGCIVCGDCLDVMRDMPDKCVDLVLTDPPYGCTDHEWDRYPTQTELDNARRISNGAIVLFGAAPPRCERAIQLLEPLYERKYIWHNTFTLTHSEGAFWQWQPIYVWGRAGLHGLGRDVISMSANFGGDDKLHPTQKPIALMQLLCAAGSEIRATILDPFCGSGTTCVAAKKLGRRYIGIDISPEYCEIARNRLLAVETGVPMKERKQGQQGLFE